MLPFHRKWFGRIYNNTSHPVLIQNPSMLSNDNNNNEKAPSRNINRFRSPPLHPLTGRNGISPERIPFILLKNCAPSTNLLS